MNKYKIVLVGDVGVGKTSLVQRLLSVSSERVNLQQDYKPTIGVACIYFACPNGCNLYILDASGSPVYQDLVQLYLKNLDAIVLVFALNDSDSLENLKQWHEKFDKNFEGDSKIVSKYVLATKIDVQNIELQKQGLSFAESIGAEFHITSAVTGINVHDFFTSVSERLVGHESMVFESMDKSDSSKLAPLYIKDVLTEDSVLLKMFPDPVLLNTSEENISYLQIKHNEVFLSTEDSTLVWRPTETNSSFGCVLNESEPIKTKALRGNPLLKYIEFQEPVNVWQHGWLENVYEVGAAIRRQPTETKLRGIQDMAFCSRTESGMEKKNGLFYMMQLTEDDNLLESGLNFPKQMTSKKADIVKNHFLSTPKPVTLQNENKISSISLTNGLAAVALKDGGVASLGCNLVSSQFEVDKHQPQHFGFGDFPLSMRLSIEIVQVACGMDFVLMLGKDGKVFSHGSSQSSCLGHGDSKERSQPAMISSLSNIKSIATGYFHALALDKYGALFSWGVDASTGKNVSKPELDYEMSYSTVSAIACGAFHSMCIGKGYTWKGNFRKKSVFTWGMGTNGALGHLVNQNVPRPRLALHMFNKKKKLIKSVSAGRNHSAFLTDDGMVYTCGMNNNGQLGYFTEEEISGQPKKVELGKNALGIEIRALRVICSEDCTMVTTEEKRVMVWGKFCYGPITYDPTPLQNTGVDIIDVTTCIVPENKGKSLCELVVALSSGSRIVLCTGVTAHGTSYDYQDLPWPDKAIISCNVSNLVRIASVGALLVALDNKNDCYYADVKLWVRNLIGEETLSSSDNKIMYNICCALEKLEPQKIPALVFEHLEISQQILQIEASLNSFLFRSELGDVFSWNPYQGKIKEICLVNQIEITYFVSDWNTISVSPVHHHVELNDQIVVQISCGMQHFAALTDSGHLYTCGVGRHAQLGHGDSKNRNTFEMVPLCRLEKCRSVSCGQVSTAVIAVSGEVYFWGQLQVSKEEKQREERMLLEFMKTCTGISPSVLMEVPTKSSDIISRSYIVDPRREELIVVGKPFEFGIEHHVKGGGIDPNVVFRVQAASSTNNNILKGKVESTQFNYFRSTLTFPKEGKYSVSVTCNGNHILRSPFIVDAEMGVPLSTLKMTLVGCDDVSLKSVASTLTTFFGEGQEGSPSLKFPLGVGVQLWGHPPVHGNQILSDIMALASLTDGGIYIYVWDGSISDFPEENVTFWLHQIASKAPQAQVVILGVNMSLEQTHRFDLKAFQRSNQNLTKAIFVASLEEEPEVLFREIQQVVERRMLTEPERIVCSKLIPLETRIRVKIAEGIEVMSRKEFVCLANECGIKDEVRIYESLLHLEKAGLALELGAEDMFVVLNQYWLTRQISEMMLCCPRGAVDVCHLDQTKEVLSEMLIKKKLAFMNAAKTRLFLVPCLPGGGDEGAKITDESSFVVVRHLVLDCPPYSLDTAFPALSARVGSEHLETSFGAFSCVIHDEQFKCRIDFGPCLINKNKSEIRFLIQSEEQPSTAHYAKSLLLSVEEYLKKECPQLYISPQVHVSCNHCLRYYFTLEVIEEVISVASTESSLKCGECKAIIVGTDLIGGYKMQSALPKLKESSDAGLIPASPPLKSFSSRQIVPRLVHHMNKQEEKILREMNLQFESMAKFFSDLKEYDVPRTFCLLPVFEEESQITGDVLVALKRSLLLYQQQKFRLHLLCEGNGDGTGIHFLEPSKHKGYEITGVNEFVLKFVGQLRSNLQMLMQLLQNLATIAPLMQAFGFGYVFLTTSTISATLGIAANKIKEMGLKQYFTQIDKFLKGFQETAHTMKQPKHLGACAKEQVTYTTSGCDYKQLRNVIKSFEGIDKFGGLTQEFRKGIGGVWVCQEHAKYMNSVSKSFEMPKGTDILKKSACL